jgi:hypothetical protein
MVSVPVIVGVSVMVAVFLGVGRIPVMSKVSVTVASVVFMEAVGSPGI